MTKRCSINNYLLTQEILNLIRSVKFFLAIYNEIVKYILQPVL